MLKNAVMVLVFCAVLSVLAGCGGSGGKKKAPDVLSDLGYTGNTSEAAVTADNADDFIGGWMNFQSGSSFSLSKPAVDSAYSGSNPLSAKFSGFPVKFNYATETETDTGAVSGTVTSTVTTNDTTGRVTDYAAVFTNYDDTYDNQANPINGNVTYSVTEYDTEGDPDGSGNYSLDFSVKVYDNTVTIRGWFAVSVNESENTAVYSNANMIAAVSSSAGQFVMKDGAYNVTFGATSITYNSGTGLFYLSDYGRVSWQISQPLVFSLYSATITSGKIIYTGAANTSIIATYSSTGVQVEVDADGNGTYETLNTYNWSYFQ